ncbi:SPOR domain-containing protein [Amphiplicatus metriothermophilus]|uniref:Sporulation related domain-containing protein n=1 Tax=Amphiplicatus metriothermophilus TaxID=1519374 RepID=A0A239PPR0_9PROT|nr:SPOR domain-containing protein [Amphiplicatus metriothermophilus]MBB5518812.1 hypothetical protein [Amphiplicatus metriothermophilus]SNT72033.1 Sporulation related domain-containing protein [Amphiplicatus metriothermophilus]
MRHSAAGRKMDGGSTSRLLGRAAIAGAALVLSACASLRGDDAPDVTGDSVDEINWAFARTAELEAEVARLTEENARLSRKLAALEAAAREAEQAASAAADEASEKEPPAAPPARPQSQAKNVIAAPEARTALAGAPVPVDPSPRLVQPSFASAEDAVFENEADDSDIPLASVLYGVHLASYRGVEEARAGWRRLQRENPDELGLLEPRLAEITLDARGTFLRLIGGGFSSAEKAAALCARLKARGVYCAVTGFDGERLSLSETG